MKFTLKDFLIMRGECKCCRSLDITLLKHDIETREDIYMCNKCYNHTWTINIKRWSELVSPCVLDLRGFSDAE